MRSYKVANMLWLAIFCCYCISQVELLVCDDDLTAFSGGYVPMEWPKLKKNKLAELVVEFQPISSTGVLFFMEFILDSDKNLISMLSYESNSLQLSVKKSLKKEVVTVTNFDNSTVVSYNSTNILSLRVIRNELQIKLNNGTWHPYTLQPRSHVIRVKDLLIGGARIFTHYPGFPVRNYFVGLLSGISVSSNCQNLMNIERTQAVVLDHCTYAFPSFVKFNVFSTPLTSVSVNPTDHFTVSFVITTQDCVGRILHLADESFTLELKASKLITRITNSLGHFMYCSSTMMVTKQAKVAVSVVVDKHSVQYVIKGVEGGSCNFSLDNVTFSGTLMIGASQNTSTPFAGYLQQVYWNGAEVNLAGVAKSQNYSCTGIGPVKCNQDEESDHLVKLSPSCIQPFNCTLRDYPIQWSTFDILVHHNFSVREDRPSYLDKDLFRMFFSVPPCLSQEQTETLEENIIFTLQEPLPAYGSIKNEEFSFANLTDVKYEQPDTDIEVSTDIIRLLVQVHCGPSILYSKHLTLYVHVEPHNDAPMVKTNPTSVVVGTSRLITRNIILMSDPDTSLEHVQCTEVNIHLSGDTDGKVSGHFEWTDPNITRSIVPFYQTDIDSGMIALRLYLNATGESLIALSVSDGKSSDHFSLTVLGTTGTIKMIVNKSIELTEGHSASISNSSLVTNTTFEDQYPVVVYLITTFPKLGEILLVHPNQFAERNVSKFTQQDIDLGKLVYSHTRPVRNSTEDCFDFKLMVEEYTGDNGTYCVKIVIEDHLPQLNISLSIKENISLNEGEIKSITIHDLAISVTPETVTRNGVVMPLSDNMLLFLTFTEMPKYGILYLDTTNGSRIPITSNITLEQFATGQLLYHHQQLEEHSDSFRIRLVPDVNDHFPIQLPDHNPEHAIFIDIIPINNNHPHILVYSSLSPTEGTYEILTNSILNITDDDRPVVDMDVFVIPKNASSSIGYFALIDHNFSISIDRFLVSELNKKLVAYVHNLGNALEESYHIIATDGTHNTTAELKVVAQPLKLSVDPVLPCSVHLDLLENNKVELHAGIVNVWLDISGSTPDIQITTTSTALLYSNDTGFFPVQNFTKRDLDLGHIWYAVIDSKTRIEKEQNELGFSIGHASVATYFVVCLRGLPYPQLLSNRLETTSVPEHGEVVVGKSVLHIASTREQTFSFGLEYELITSPTSGQLVLIYSDFSSGPARRFSQDFVNNGSVIYRNHNFSGGSDMFVLAISNQYYKYTENITVQVTINLLRLHVVNDGFVATEGENHTISKSDLYAQGPPGYNVVFFITSSPKYGFIYVGNATTKVTEFTKEDLDKGLVVYSNDGDEHYYDSMNLTIRGIPATPQASNNITEADTTYVGTVNITINLVNDHTPRPWNRTVLEVVNGHTAIITSYVSSFQDDDINMNISFLRYSVIYHPSDGDIVFVNNNSKTDSFLQLSIFNHEIGYRHNRVNDSNDMGETDFCGVSVSDGNNKAVEFIHIIIVPYTILPSINKTLVLNEGNSSKISDENILFVADKAKPPANDSEYTYNITKTPEHGELRKRGSSCACSFTQEELENGFIIYQHDGSDSTSDYFEFVVTVRGYSTATMTMVITVNPVDDEPPTVIYMSQLLVNYHGEIYFNNSILLASDTEAPTSDLWFTIETFPRFGRILCDMPGRNQKAVSNFTQLKVEHWEILYRHEKVEEGNWIDTVTLSLVDGKNKYGGLIEISIVLIPPVLPVIVTETEIDEGEIERLNTEHVIIDHPFLSTLEFYINITEQPKYGKIFSIEDSQSILYFNSSTMNNRSLFYYYNDDQEQPQDFFKFRAAAGGIISEEHRYVFNINQINDEEPTVEKNRLVSMWAGEAKLITTDYLLAKDKDTNPPDNLTFVITNVNSSFGHFAYRDALLVPIANFSQDDIDAEIVVFQSHHTKDGTEINVNFILNDGMHNVDVVMTMEINKLTVTVNPQSIVVKMSGVYLLQFQAVTNDYENREIYYIVNATGELGAIVDAVSGDIITNFTQTQIDHQQIKYQHTAVDQWEKFDSIKFNVYAELTEIEPVYTTLTVEVVLTKSNTSYLAVSTAISLDEGGKICLTDSVLDARNVLYNVWKTNNKSFSFHDLSIRYNVFYPPVHGNLTIDNVSVMSFNHVDLKNSTKVCYCHDDSETDHDSFSVTISLIHNSSVWYHNSTIITVPISIRAVNDEIPEFDGAIDMITDKWYMFTDTSNTTNIIQPNELHLTDIDTPDDQLFYVIVNNTGGQYQFISTDQPVTNFTQQDINRRRVQYIPKLSNSTSTFYYTDGNNPSSNYTIHYYQIDLRLDTKVLQELDYFQNESSNGIVLTTSHIHSRTNGYQSDTIYNIISQPVHGNLVKDSDGQFIRIVSFTQSDIDSNLVKYNVTDTSSYTDNFTMEVTNRHESSGPYTLVFMAKALININNSTVLSLSSTGGERPLPIGLFNASQLAALSQSDPTFTVVEPPVYGHLKVKSEKKRNAETFTFTWKEFSQHKVLYSLNEGVFNSSDEFNSSVNEVTEVFVVIVEATGMQAGIANLSFVIIEDIFYTSTAVVTSPTPSNSSYTTGAAFTLFALVPIIGVPCFVLLVIAILIGFWYSQKLKEKRRWAAAQGTSAICMGSHSQFSLPRQTLAASEIDHHSDQDSALSNSDEGISMPMDHLEDDIDPVQYLDDPYRVSTNLSTPYHPLHTAKETTAAESHHASHMNAPILKSIEYWI